MINQKIEDGIERYIRHVRKMSSLNDDQIRIAVSGIYGQDPDSIGIIKSDVENYIENIRQMSSLSDAQLRSVLREAAAKDSALEDIFDEAENKKLLSEMKNVAKDIKSDPRKFARKVDREH